MKAAMKAGAPAATIYFARGSGIRERLTVLLKIAISPEKEVIEIVASTDKADAIFEAMVEAGERGLSGKGPLYVTVSGAIRRLCDDVTPVVEPLSIDEAFLDLTGVVGSFEEARETGRRIKERIRAEERLTASVGVAPNKFLAKVASDLEKPDGLVVLQRSDVPARLWPLPVRALWGVGPVTAESLHGLGIRTVGDILRAPRERLASRLGEGMAAHLRALAEGVDDRPVETSREARSISEERTYAVDLRDPEEIDRQILARSEGVARSLRD